MELILFILAFGVLGLILGSAMLKSPLTGLVLGLLLGPIGLAVVVIMWAMRKEAGRSMGH